MMYSLSQASNETDCDEAAAGGFKRQRDDVAIGASP
jgi:hypothetical protein